MSEPTVPDGAGTGRSRSDGAGRGWSRSDGAGTGRSRSDGAGTGRSRSDGAGRGWSRSDEDEPKSLRDFGEFSPSWPPQRRDSPKLQPLIHAATLAASYHILTPPPMVLQKITAPNRGRALHGLTCSRDSF